MIQTKRTCVECGKKYDANSILSAYCSDQCKNNADHDRRRFGGRRDDAIKRDSYECVVCGSKDQIVVHHKNFDATDHRLRNLATLCRGCHARIHAPFTINGPIGETKTCIICDGEFKPIKKTQFLCSRKECRAEWKKINKRSEHGDAECLVCGEVFTQKHNTHKTCSPSCRLIYTKKQKRDEYKRRTERYIAFRNELVQT